jgi:copper chaperone CopZ
MSRREEEFKHRTSIFEGAYRAWSHLGGLDPNLLRRLPAKDLDPITFTNRNNDPLIKKANDSVRLEYPYEPLPRAGLAHPFIQAILSPWLGPNADQEAVELGLATLRTWWQHRRKGENKSAIKILGTAKMREIVDTYARHFFELAHCLVVVDLVQPPRTLHLAMKQLGTATNPRRRPFVGGDEDDLSSGALGNSDVASQDTSVEGGDFLLNLSPLERVHLVQKNAMQLSSDEPVINVKGKCIPGKIDLPGIVDAVKRHANTLAHRGGMAVKTSRAGGVTDPRNPVALKETKEASYGDPNTMPIIFQTNKNANLIIMDVGGITCAHCVKIVETVLKGCQGGKSPIAGLLDAAADRAVSCVVVAIDHPSNAKRIAFESARNLKLVGYTARVKEVSIPATSDASAQEALYNSVVRMAKAYPFDVFQFSAPCSCPDSGVFRDNCQRYVHVDFFLCQ